MKEINVEQIKAYNTRLREYKEKSSRLEAEINVRTNELQRVCDELTKELGRQVTPENVEQIYDEYVEKISKDLEQGMAILQRIANEEQQAAQAAQAQAAQAQTVQAQSAQAQRSVAQPAQGGVPQPVQGGTQQGGTPQGNSVQMSGQMGQTQNASQGAVQSMGGSAVGGMNTAQAQGQVVFMNGQTASEMPVPPVMPNNMMGGEGLGLGLQAQMETQAQVQAAQSQAGQTGQTGQAQTQSQGQQAQAQSQQTQNQQPAGLFGNKFSGGANTGNTNADTSSMGIPLVGMFGDDDDDTDDEFAKFFGSKA